MQNRVDFVSAQPELGDGFFSRKNRQLHTSALGFEHYGFHYRQAACAPGADHQPSTLPRDLFFKRERSVPEFLSELSGGFLLALAHLATINHDVVIVQDAVDPKAAEGKITESHLRPL
ncbi:MAG TPA: hypothetical protein VJX29_07075 [Candidatus Acidoferrales bacterium]|nr:hypothetical protein [Candidatus Acidoferrales bacterium]